MKNKILFYIIGIITLLIIGPLILTSGYVFSLDLNINPNGWLPSWGSHIWWIGMSSQIFNFLNIPMWVLQKLVFILIFVILVFGSYKFFKKDHIDNKLVLFGILFFIFNPVFYERFVDGQINIFTSYAIYPIFFFLLRSFFEKLDNKNILYLGLLGLLLNLTSTHNVVLIAVLYFSFGLVYFSKYKNIKYFLSLFKLGVFTILINFLWFIPLIFSSNKFGLVDIVNNFNKNDFNAFSFCLNSGENIYFKALELKGYWGECMGNRFVELGNLYTTFFIILFGFVLYGIYRKLKDKSFLYFDKSLILLFIVSYILTFGVSHNNIFSVVSDFLYTNISFYRGFREPQKWLMFIVFIYGYFAVFGLKYFVGNFKNYTKKNIIFNIFIYFIIFLPVIGVYQILFGFNGQLKSVNYPKELAVIKTELKDLQFKNDCTYLKEKKSNKCYNGVVFPWHAYMGRTWIGRRTLSGVGNYFGKNMLLADNVEIGDIYSQSSRPESKIIEKYLKNKGGIFRDEVKLSEALEFIKDLKGLGIKYIILEKEVDYKFYYNIINVLKKEGFFNIIKENRKIVLYKLIN